MSITVNIESVWGDIFNIFVDKFVLPRTFAVLSNHPPTTFLFVDHGPEWLTLVI